jgi:hypothetical protein
MGDKPLCASVSQQVHESLLGTAPTVDLWLLLEYAGSWEADAIAQSALSAQVRVWIEHAKMVYPYVRTQFIRHRTRPATPFTCFIGISQESRQALYKFQLESYEDILNLNVPAIAAGHVAYEPYLFNEPLFLVCTHGKHDRCCAKFGLPIYRELDNIVGENAWQSSHVGGERFAANMICLPYGIYYGRVTLTEIEAIVHATRRQQVYIEKYRGRTCYAGAVQVADALLRNLLGRREIDAFQFIAVQDSTEHHCTISFESLPEHCIHRLSIIEEETEVSSHSVCKGLETYRVKSYRLSTYEVRASTVCSPP